MVTTLPKPSISNAAAQAKSTNPAREDALIRVGPMGQIPAVLRTLGIDPEPVFSEIGYTLEQFRDPDFRISYLKNGQLLARCAAESGCEHFGLLTGQSASPSQLGTAGYLLRSAPDVASALEDLLHNLDLHDEGGSITLSTANGVTLLGYTVHQPEVEGIDQIYDLAIALGCNILRTLCGPAWVPTEIALARKKPRNTRPYKNFFKTAVRFDAEESTIVFPSRWLDHAVPSADAFLHRHIEKEASTLHKLKQRKMLDRIPEALHQGLLRQQFSAREIALEFKIKERTLHRRLRAAGTTYRNELDKVRLALSLNLLTNTDLTIAEIADTLAYKGPSAFIRAFRRWRGEPPQSWRRRQSPESTRAEH
jgi:AraC-like DNA-binding protein